MPVALAVSSGAVAESAFGPPLYVLSSNKVGSAIAMQGGHLDHYAIGSDGLLTAAGGTTVPGGAPTALAVVVAR